MMRLLFLLWLICSLAQAQPLMVGTYNLRYKNSADSTRGNGWERRCPEICGQINFLQPDIFGTQEGLAEQLLNMQACLPDYDCIGSGRNDGRHGGEHCAVFYRKSEWKLLKSGDFWLSPTPDTPSKGWDAALPRICTWGAFQQIASAKVLYFFNLHFDHVGTTARKESAQLVLQKIKEIAGSAPVVLTGDFNVDQESEVYESLAGSELLADSYETARYRYAPVGTFNSFNTSKHTDKRIDHVFVSPTLRVDAYGVLTNGYWTHDSNETPPTRRIPSDHYPVFVRLGF